jgi:hypothetical protein
MIFCWSVHLSASALIATTFLHLLLQLEVLIFLAWSVTLGLNLASLLQLIPFEKHLQFVTFFCTYPVVLLE